VFELAAETSGAFDVVYSWGVLHHTGAMHEALRRATQAVAPGGHFAFALYHRTRMCGFWRREKRWYAAASPRAQRVARAIYTALLRLRVGLTGGDFRAYVANYHSQRGMEFGHDVHDWMGGYPYESISAPEVAAFMQRLGFAHVRSFTSPLTIGLFGSGCDEYVYRRIG
jgi:2-polyprenyl-6-hydroxyphenyl methylase/3-demethylubiquinone-9 3-methyltransferase